MSEFETDIRSIEKQYQCYRNLWAEKLSLMIDDLNQKIPEYTLNNYKPKLRALKRTKIQQVKNRKEKTARWLRSNRNEIASFIWICEVLDIDPKRIRNKLGLAK